MAGTEKKRIIELTEASTVQSGDFIAVDSNARGTKKVSTDTLATSAALTAETNARAGADEAEAQAREAADNTLGGQVADLRSDLDKLDGTSEDAEIVWSEGYIDPIGKVWDGTASYRRSQAVEIPNDCKSVTIRGYSQKSNISAIAFYSSSSTLTDTTVIEYYILNDGLSSHTYAIPAGAVCFVCSKEATNNTYEAFINYKGSVDVLRADVDAVLPLVTNGYKTVQLGWQVGFVSTDGTFNSTATSYRRTDMIPIPKGATKVKVEDYTINTSLCAVCLYNSDTPSTTSALVKVSPSSGTEIEIPIPSNATHFAFSKKPDNSNFEANVYFENIYDIVSEKQSNSINGEVSFYGKKIVLGGDSITHGVGGTGFAQDGEIIATFSGNTYRRNPNGYCWAKLFAQLMTEKYGATVINNGCTGTTSGQWANNIDALLPSDTDIFILTVGTNDRHNDGTTYDAVKATMFSNFNKIKQRCDQYGITLLLFAPVPASAENEALPEKYVHMYQIAEIIKSWCIENSVRFYDLYNRVFEYYWDKGEPIGTYADGLHPNDAMYYVMFYQYCFLLEISPSIPIYTAPN